MKSEYLAWCGSTPCNLTVIRWQREIRCHDGKCLFGNRFVSVVSTAPLRYDKWQTNPFTTDCSHLTVKIYQQKTPAKIDPMREDTDDGKNRFGMQNDEIKLFFCLPFCLSGLVWSGLLFFSLASKYQSSHYQIEYIRWITEFRLMLKRQLTLYRAPNWCVCLCLCVSLYVLKNLNVDACDSALSPRNSFPSKCLSQADVWRCFRVRRVDFKAWRSHVFLYTHTQSKNGSKSTVLYRRLSNRRAALETYVF